MTSNHEMLFRRVDANNNFLFAVSLYIICFGTLKLISRCDAEIAQYKCLAFIGLGQGAPVQCHISNAASHLKKEHISNMNPESCRSSASFSTERSLPDYSDRLRKA